jgi:hypothetical protein
MKRLLCFICCCLVLTISTHAQSADEKKVAAAVESLRKALIDPTKEQLDELTAPQLSYGHSSGKMEDKSTFIESLTSKLFDFVTVELTQQTINIVGNTALVRHNLTGTTNDGGKPGTARIGVLQVWQKQQGKWKLLARQAFKLV